ncbi:MAG: NAD(P)H-hydrate dehydratase [Clostridia bacterium]|nr:NAD(P)H-hydrate dehydratase [Clostridia bacterium]
MQSAVSVALMRQSDQKTIEKGASGFELMHRAGEAVYRAVSWHGKIAILCGSGNNGGDGYVLAGILQKCGYAPTVVRVSDRFSSDGRACYEEALAVGVADCMYSQGMELSAYDVIVDCLLGTGFYGSPTGLIRAAIEAINHSGAYVVSVDINSGLNGDNGLGECCVISDLTVSVGTVKTGLLLGRAKDKVKSYVNADIGIPIIGRAYHILEDGDVASVFTPRAHTSHKGTYGYITLLGGCLQYSGAAKLSNLSSAAMRAGTGVCRLAVPEEIANAVAPYLLESTLEPLPSKGGFVCFDSQVLDRLLTASNAMAVGMGWGNGPDNGKILKYLLLNSAKPLLIDADGLNTLAVIGTSVLKEAKCPIILTPHLREFSRISGIPDGEILNDPIVCAERFAKEYGVVLLLKGATTIVTNGEDTFLSVRGCPGMATAGSGDVLSGVLAALLGYLPSTAFTVACGAYVTGLAGELAERDTNPISMCASDTVKHLPTALNQILKMKEENK